jgi:ArsR family transcriptional regulator
MVTSYCKFSSLSEVLKILGHPVRLCILNRLLENGPCNVATLQHCLRQPQSTVSQHLQKLRSAGLIHSSSKGPEKIYTINGDLNLKLLEYIFEYNKNAKKSIIKLVDTINY